MFGVRRTTARGSCGRKVSLTVIWPMLLHEPRAAPRATRNPVDTSVDGMGAVVGTGTEPEKFGALRGLHPRKERTPTAEIAE